MSSDCAIRATGLGKCYRIYASPRDRLRQALVPRLLQLLPPVLRPAPRPYFSEFWALQGLDFQVKRGETVGIIGRNGAGKSTLLQLLCGTLQPTTGTVEVAGRIGALLELGAGFNPEFTGRENVFLNGAILGLEQQEIRAKFDDIAAFAEIGAFMERPVKTYSSGMYMRLAFAVMAHIDADILVVDEALAVGDALFTQKCMRFLRRFQETGTILFVSHDLGAVTNLCRRALWLEDGRLRMAGAAKEVCEAYLAETFGCRQKSEPRSQGNGPLRVLRPPPAPKTAGQRRPLHAGGHRGDLQIFHFDPARSGFGVGGGEIHGAALLDPRGEPLGWMVGGEEVVLQVRARALRPLRNPIIGFYVKDRLGQYLFGDNTYLNCAGQALAAEAAEGIEARFRFRMPVLPAGDYSVCVALAEGTQENHVQHQWIHDALVFRSQASSVVTGLVGIPMEEITLTVTPVRKEQHAEP